MHRIPSLFRTAARRAVPFLVPCAFLLALAAHPAPAAAAVTIKMATLAPDGSVWDEILSEMGSDWQKATGGEVQLRLYPGGVAGDEPDLIRKMRIGQLQAASLTVAGLSELDPGFDIFEVPFLFDSYDELFHVLDAMRPVLEKRLEDKGYVLVHWMQGGWVHFFSKEPIKTVEDLKKQKLFVWAGDDQLVQLWRKNGFQPVALAATDVMTALQTGMIEALPATPLAALSLQWFRQTPYLQGLGLAPLIGGTVIRKSTWDKLSPGAQQKIREVALATEKRLMEEVPDQDQRAIEQMKERGLKVVDIPPDLASAWRKAADEFIALKRSQMETPELLDETQKILDAYRREHGSASGK